MRRPRGWVYALAGAALVLASAAALLSLRLVGAQSVRFADADDRVATIAGAHVYAGQCAPCHGRRLQGQPLWQLVDENSGRRAPALDATGRAWSRSDEDLFDIVKFGRYADTPKARRSHMPAFQSRLDDREIWSVLAFVKARWPIGPRALQALRNPGREGMPRVADNSDWRLPPTCLSPESLAEAAAR